MTFLPVVTRELRVAARKPRTFWVRSFVALVAAFLFFWIWFAFGQAFGSAKQGSSVFSGLAGFAMAYCLFMGATTADSISEEKRGGTLGLLFLTDLRGFDVVLGKLVATSLNSFYGLIAIFPLLAVPLLLGGVTVGEFWRLVLVLTITLFFSLSCGMFCSAFSKSDRKSRGLTILLVVIFAAVIPFVHSVRNRFAPGQTNFSLWASPTFTYAISFDAEYARSSFDFWCSISVLTGFSLLLLAIASIALPKLWQDRPAGSREASFRKQWRHWSAGNPFLRTDARTRMLDLNPYYWLASRPLLKSVYPFIFLALVGAIWLWLNHRFPRDMQDTFIYVITMLTLHTSIKSWLASEASRLFSQDRFSGAWELTLSTPLSVTEIIKGQLLALHRQFTLPALIVLAVDFTLTFTGTPNGRPSGNDRSWVTVCTVGMIVFVADLFAISWVGMWLGIRSSKPGRAAAGTMARVLALPWIVFIGIVSLTGIARVAGSFNPTWQLVLSLWLFISLATDIIFGASSARNLFRFFRGFATTRFETSSTFPRMSPRLSQVPAESAPAGQEESLHER